MFRKKATILLIFACVFYVFLISCEQEEFVKDPSASLSLSTDTLMFDTVFTNLGSTTKWFTVKNPYNKKINIRTIKLAGGKDSDYRLNINGSQTCCMSNLELNANDSLYIFVEVTIDPNKEKNPLVVKDSVIFNVNGNTQDIKLVAWGQDVHLINDKVLKTQTWKADKPYLVYNSALVDTQHTLTIEPGTKIHFHANSSFHVAGTLISDGTKEKPILFTSERLEEEYSDIPGQWNGIWLMPGSNNNVINYTNIKNAITGIQVDSIGNNASLALTLSNSKIMHMTYAGIHARGTTIKGYNNVISNCGKYAVALTQGGSYEFYHMTIANYWTTSTRNTPSLLLNNYDKDNQERELKKAQFNNCIIYGNNVYELGFDSLKSSEAMNYKFEHCLIKTGQETQTPGSNYNNIIENESPGFISIEDSNFKLDTLSTAIDTGDVQTGEIYPKDILNNSRNSDKAPDLGAYEYIPGTGKQND